MQAWRKAQALAQDFRFPPGYGPKKDEANARILEMQKNMIFMITLASLLIYLVLGASFNSLLLPLAVLVTIPGAILSGIFGLWLLSLDLDVMARLSLVILVGIGVNNAIILIDVIQELRLQGFSKCDAVVHGCARRFQAVLMTTAIQVLGVLPVALGNSKIMGIPYASLGITIISGMLLSTVMTLALLPWLYDRLSALEDWWLLH
jgi:HAE1 family hydrophobic/amphiphilic exporter-1